MFDVDRLRSDFPSLTGDGCCTYLDSAATSLKPRQVLEALTGYYQDCCANIHRGAYAWSIEATERYERARQQVARFVGASRPEHCIFTRGTTESINLLVQTWGEHHVGPGDDIVLTAMEHHANLVPWQQLAIRKAARLRWVELTGSGELDLDSLDRALDGQPRVLACTWVSNVFGTINPVQEIVRRARARGALTVLDAAQAVPHLPCRVDEVGCDFLAFSGHKMLGPTGIGVLWGCPALMEALPPYHFGGDMILKVERDRTTYNELPNRLEAGTPNIAGAIGLGAACEYLSQVGMDAVRAHERELLQHAFRVLGALEGIHLFGPNHPERQSGVISFGYRGIHPHDLATLLDEQQVCIRAGHHCCQPLMRDLKISGTARASFYLYTTLQEIDRLAAALQKASEVFANVAL